MKSFSSGAVKRPGQGFGGGADAPASGKGVQRAQALWRCPRRAPVRRGQPKERAFAKDFVRKTVFTGKKLAKQFGM
ncbi:hypothetical protein D7X33_17450 [Butyricicoccus sp. 1XD8-22]|nr:hypothetical protein D7X33_17450 [Butyricicoccus sp. 1XD8-22]